MTATLDDVIAKLQAMHNDLYAHRLAVVAAIQDQTTAIVAAIKAGGVAAAPVAGTTTASIDYFPAAPGDAPFPSPENARIVRLNGVISGEPYLLDSNGTVHTLGVPHLPLSGYYVGDHEVLAWDNSTYNELLVRGGNGLIGVAVVSRFDLLN